MCGPPLTDKFISHQCQYQSRIFAACRRSQTLKDKTPTAVASNLCSLVAFDVLSVRSFDPAVRYLKYEFVSNALTFVALDKGPSAEPNRPHSEEKKFPHKLYTYDIYTFCYWHIFWHSTWHVLWHSTWHIFCHLHGENYIDTSQFPLQATHSFHVACLEKQTRQDMLETT